MLSLEKDHARLEIAAGEEFERVSESIRMLFQLCRVNGLRGALIVSRQAVWDWRSCMRLGIRFCASRGALPDARLALVVQGSELRQREDVTGVAGEAGLACRVFEHEPGALAWLRESGPALRIIGAS